MALNADTTQPDHHFDVAICGGGLVGLAMANALKESDLKIAVIDAQDRPEGSLNVLPVADRPVRRWTVGEPVISTTTVTQREVQEPVRTSPELGSATLGSPADTWYSARTSLWQPRDVPKHGSPGSPERGTL